MFGNGKTGYVGRNKWFLDLGNGRRKIGKKSPFGSALHTFHGPCQVRVHFQQMSSPLNLKILETATLQFESRNFFNGIFPENIRNGI